MVAASEEWELGLGVKLLFESAVDTLSDEGRAVVSAVAVELGKIGITRVRVEGHTDNVGTAKYNVRRLERRAESVARSAAHAGFREDAIERKGYGVVKPVADNATAAGRLQNRRVVIAVQVDRSAFATRPAARSTRDAAKTPRRRPREDAHLCAATGAMTRDRGSSTSATSRAVCLTASSILRSGPAWQQSERQGKVTLRKAAWRHRQLLAVTVSSRMAAVQKPDFNGG